MNLSKPYPHYCATHAVYYGSPTDTIPATMCPLCGISQELKAQPAPRTYEVARALSWIDAVEQRGPVEEQKPEMWRVLTDEGIWYRGPGSNGPLVFTDYNKAYWEANRISGRVQALFASPVTADVEPASLGAEAAAQKIYDEIWAAMKDPGLIAPSIAWVDLIAKAIRTEASKHQPIKAGTAAPVDTGEETK